MNKRWCYEVILTFLDNIPVFTFIGLKEKHKKPTLTRSKIIKTQWVTDIDLATICKNYLPSQINKL